MPEEGMVNKFFLAVIIAASLCYSARIVNHTSIVDFPPDSMIDSIQLHDTIYFCSRSHGTQIKAGMDSLARMDAKYAVPEWHAVWGQPVAFWQGTGAEDTRTYLDAHPGVTVAMFVWCRELAADLWTEANVIEYFDSLEMLEDEYPNITWVYSTGNSQWYGGSVSEMTNRWDRHLQIRSYCQTNDKWLFDFGNMDAYYWTGSAWTDSSYDYGNGTYDTVEMLHHEYDNVASEDDPQHTTWMNGLNKGRAMWQLLAMIRGWNPDAGSRRSDWNMTPIVRVKDKNTTAYTYDPIFALRTDSSGSLFRGSIGSASIHFWHYNIGGLTTAGAIAGSNLSHCGNGVWRARFPASDLNTTDSIFKYRMYGTNIDTTIVKQMRLR